VAVVLFDPVPAICLFWIPNRHYDEDNLYAGRPAGPAAAGVFIIIIMMMSEESTTTTTSRSLFR